MTKKNNTIFLPCNRIHEQFSMAFLHATKQGPRSLIIVSIKSLITECHSYFKERTNMVKWSSHDQGNPGFYLKLVENKTDVSSYDSVSIILSNIDTNFSIDNYIYNYSNIQVIITTITEEKVNYWHSTIDESVTIPYLKEKKMLKNIEIYKQFKDTFLIAKKEINIICPWINQTVVNASLLKLIENALSRGVNIKIIFGIGEGQDTRSLTSDNTVEMLKEHFKFYQNQLIFKKDNTHIKLLLCDDKYQMIGSYNFLSFAGNYSLVNMRNEVVQYDVDKRSISIARQDYFSW